MPVGVGGKQAAPAAPPVAAPPAAPPAAPAGAGPAKKGKGKLILILLIVILLLALVFGGGVVAYLLLSKGSSEAEPTVTQHSQGELSVTTGEPVLNITLADGSYLVFAATIYFNEEVVAEGEEGGEIDPAPARDVAYRLFSGLNKEDLVTPKGMEEAREKYKAMLNAEKIEPYHEHVYSVLFTQWVFSK